MVAMGAQICELQNSITKLTLLWKWLPGWLEAILGLKRKANAKITHKAHQLQLVTSHTQTLSK